MKKFLSDDKITIPQSITVQKIQNSVGRFLWMKTLAQNIFKKSRSFSVL